MEEKIYCSHCGALIEGDEYETVNGEIVCTDCYENHTTTCDRCGSVIWLDDSYGDEYTTLCSNCYHNHYTRCSCCDALLHEDDREAEMLAQRITPMDIAAYYVSPLGRAQATAEYTLKKCGRTTETLDWLHEFDRNLIIGSDGQRRIAWDKLPKDCTSVPLPVEGFTLKNI